MNRARVEIIYSIVLLLVIPSLLAFNTILLSTNVRTDYDKELQSRAELANTVFASSLSELVATKDVQLLQARVVAVAKAQNELQNLAVISKDANDYAVLAAADPNYEISNSDTLQYDIVYSRNWPVAKSIGALTQNGARTRAWNVASPITVNNQVVGIVSSDLLTTDVDEKFDATLERSIIIMVISAVAVMVLLFNHFRFIGYAQLLRKQKELNQTMSDFLSVATHELKAPLSIIKGYIANVMEGDFGDVSPEVKEQLTVAFTQTDRLNDLVQDLLNVSRIEQGRISFDIKPVNATAIIRTIVANYQPLATEKNIEIFYEPTNDIWLQADEGRVQEIFTNLIDNAVKYSMKGEVRITHTEQDGKIVTSVRDSGIGMTTEERQRLFQRFYRVKNDKTKTISGTGLGLWIIKQYIEKMGGKISVDSLLDTGTEFRVSLPAAAPQQT